MKTFIIQVGRLWFRGRLWFPGQHIELSHDEAERMKAAGLVK